VSDAIAVEHLGDGFIALHLRHDVSLGFEIRNSLAAVERAAPTKVSDLNLPLAGRSKTQSVFGRG
jgi:hypothetical protein